MLREEAAWRFKDRYMTVADEEYLEAMRAGIKLAHARGVTAVHDKDGWLGALRLWQRLEAAGSLSLRVWQSIPHDQVERYYSLCEVMAYPRKRSRLTDLVTPLKPLEAMAQGRIVAASNVGGHRELITDGLTGTLFPPDDPAACAQTLANLLARADRWPEMRGAARSHVVANHDWEQNAVRYQAVYQALLKPAGKARARAAA